MRFRIVVFPSDFRNKYDFFVTVGSSDVGLGDFNSIYFLFWHQLQIIACKAKINNMLVSGNMTPKKMGRKVGKKFCPIFYLMTHLFPTAQLKYRGVEDQKKNI